MAKSIEITGKYQGERFRFENAGSDPVIIGSIRLGRSSKEQAILAGIDPDEPVTIKGQADDEDLEHGRTYRFFGGWVDYKNARRGTREKQFAFRTFVAHIPHDVDGLIDYLSHVGRGNGIGPSKAAMLVEFFGVDDVLAGCRESAEQVAKICKIRLDQAASFNKKLSEQAATENATLEVDRLLNGRGFPKTLGRAVIKQWGNLAAEQIATDPYSLMQFRGVGFGLTDKLYISLGKDPLSIDRQALCLWYGMASDNDGHTWFTAADAVSRLTKTIGGNIDYRAAILRGKEYGQLSESHYGAIASLRTDTTGAICEDGESVWLAEGKNAAAEKCVADGIAAALHESRTREITTFANIEHIETEVMKHATCQRCYRQLTAPVVHVLDGKPFGPTCINYVDHLGLSESYSLQEWLELNPRVFRWIEQQPRGVISLPEISLWPDPESIEGITDHQREQAALALSDRIGLLGGGPGCGKTHVLAAIIRAVFRTGRVAMHQICVGAPTGKAAVRLTEELAKANLPIRARTWHSLLGVGGSDNPDGSNTAFKFGEREKWPYKIIFGDETSMPPINIMAAIFRARAPDAHMLFTGDVNQLAPVGNGAPFRDMITACLPYGELVEIHRNSGGIVESCRSIREEQPWAHEYTDNTQNLWITGDQTPKSQLHRMLEIIHDSEERGYDPVWDVQVLVAVNKSSELSRQEVNKLLQDKLNSNPTVPGTPFRVDDKVVCLKNGFYKSLSPVDQEDEDYDANDSGEVFVANGELGKVIEVEPKTLIVQLENPERLIQIPRGKADASDNDSDDEKATTNTGCQWDLGYALSVHKFQGSEQKITIGMLDRYAGARRICDRAWIYTLNSRAKEKSYLVGTADTAERFCKANNIDSRKTMLSNLIKLAMFEHEMKGCEI